MDGPAKVDFEDAVWIHGNHKNSKKEKQNKIQWTKIQPDSLRIIPWRTNYEKIHCKLKENRRALKQNGLLWPILQA